MIHKRGIFVFCIHFAHARKERFELRSSSIHIVSATRAHNCLDKLNRSVYDLAYSICIMGNVLYQIEHVSVYNAIQPASTVTKMFNSFYQPVDYKIRLWNILLQVHGTLHTTKKNL